MTDVRRVWLVVGAALAAAFRAEGLISEYILSVMPVLLGAGIPLFAGPGPAASVGLQWGFRRLRPLPAAWCSLPTGSPNSGRRQKPGALLNESLQG
jgi:riboflavin biosynthesis pyrimidine reductase